MDGEISCGLAAPAPVPGEVFVEAGGLDEVVAAGLDGGDVLGADEGLDEVDAAARVGVEPVHDELGLGFELGGAVVLPVPAGGAELVVPWLGDVETEAGGDVEGVVFGLPLGLPVGWSVPLELAPGEAVPPELVAVPPLAGLLDEVTGGVAARLVRPGVPVLEIVTAGLEDSAAQGLGVAGPATPATPLGVTTPGEGAGEVVPSPSVMGEPLGELLVKA